MAAEKKTNRIQAVILAAGRGVRLGQITERLPKVLVEVNQTPFIINQLEALAESKKVDQVVIVVGYKGELIRKAVGASYRGMDIVFVENVRWAETNNIYSLWLTCKHVKSDFILMEGDIFFEHKMIDPLLENKAKNIVLLAKYKPSMSGTVVEINEKTGAIGRLISSRDQGENFDFSNKFKTVNVYYFTYQFFKEFLCPSIELYVHTHIKDYWELMLGVLIYLHVDNIYPYVVSDELKWYEVDDETDLDTANYLFASNENKMKILAHAYGGLWRYNIIDFCYLVNPYFPTKQVIDEISSNLPDLMQNYPSGQRNLCRLLLRWFKDSQLEENNLVVGNGASELIRIINKHLIRKVTIPVPTFNEYEDVEEKQRNYFMLEESEDFKLDPTAFSDEVKLSGSNFAILINPNNPTGTLYSKTDVTKVIEKLPSLDGIIIDESFIGFSGNREKHSVQSLVNKYPNLAVIHSIGKEYGVLGLRLGYMVTSNEKILKVMKRHLPIWNINSIAEKFIEIFPKYSRNFEESLKNVVSERTWLNKQLGKFSFLKVYESQANFFLCKLTNGCTSEEFSKKLFEKSIYIKDCSAKTALNNKFVRIAVRARQDNEALVTAISELETA